VINFPAVSEIKKNLADKDGGIMKCLGQDIILATLLYLLAFLCD